MIVRVEHYVHKDMIPALLKHARILGLDYGDADTKTILIRLYTRYGQSAEVEAFEPRPEEPDGA